MRLDHPKTAPPLHPFWLITALIFIIYGSLVPLNFQPHSLTWAWAKFEQTPFLALGLDSRADWIANGVLYFPAGLLLAERFVGRLKGLALASALLISLCAVTLLAFGVEFAQIFFPPRTVSQNDLLAEVIGGTLGILCAWPLSHRIRRLVAFKPTDSQEGVTQLLKLYVAAYILYCLFPFDFLLSAHEISAKMTADRWGWLFANNPPHNPFRTLIALCVEVAAISPLGILIARHTRHSSNRSLANKLSLRLISSGFLLGISIEALQFFTYSGVSQGASTLTRAAGVYLGGMLWTQASSKLAHSSHHAFQTKISLWQNQLQRHTGKLTLIYLIGLGLFANWFYRPWGNLDTASNALTALHFLPFYYHYYVSEANALTSLLSVALLFAPLGVIAAFSSRSKHLTITLPFLLSAALETAKLFSTRTHADPTNILIAVAATHATWVIMQRLLSPSHENRSLHANNEIPHTDPMQNIQALVAQSRAEKSASTSAAKAPTSSLPIPKPPAKLDLAVLGLVAAGLAYWLINFPVHPWLLATVFFASAVAVWYQPLAALLIIPAALPLFDLAPWSGRFYLDEFDALLAITLAVGYTQTPLHSAPWHPAVKWALGLLVLSFFFSTLHALFPWQSIDDNAFITYLSQFNALRISKGLVWALLFAGLVRRLTTAEKSVFQWFAWGMTLGLAAVVAVMVREKFMFGGLLNFSSDYRATGPFSAIHTGGAYVECYLAVATPFLLYLIISTHQWLLRVAGVILLLASTYTLMATVSRNGFAGYGIACGLALLTLLAGHSKKIKRLVQITLLAGAALAVAVPLFEGSFVQKRMSQVSTDLGVRQAHWQDGLSIRDNGWLTEIFGMGIGRFPDAHFWRSRETFHPSVHALSAEADNRFLRIAPGYAMYIEQIVPVEPHQRYRLRFNVRSASPGATVGIALCEKWMLASSRCATWQKSQRIAQANQWQTVEQTINTSELGSGHWVSQRPVKLSFFNNGILVDVDNIQLTTPDGNELIANGDFSRRMDHWYFSTDEHLAWHIKSMPLAILFDQGWLGVLAFSLFLATTIYLASRAAWQGNHAAGIALAATTGFLIVGLFDTLIDAPRFLFLLITLALISTLNPKAYNRQQASAKLI